MTLATIIQAISVVVAAASVTFAVTAWRREYTGKRNIELAEEVLALFYQARDVIAYIRSPFSFSGEGTTRPAPDNETPDEKRINNQVYVVFERYNKNKEVAP